MGLCHAVALTCLSISCPLTRCHWSVAFLFYRMTQVLHCFTYTQHIYGGKDVDVSDQEAGTVTDPHTHTHWQVA